MNGRRETKSTAYPPNKHKNAGQQHSKHTNTNQKTHLSLDRAGLVAAGGHAVLGEPDAVGVAAGAGERHGVAVLLAALAGVVLWGDGGEWGCG